MPSRTCRKQKHKKLSLAKSEAKRMADKYGVPYNGYKCGQCGKYHVGRSNKREIIESRKVFLEKNAAVLGIDPGITGAICLMCAGYIEIYDYKSVIECFKLIKLLKRKFKVKFVILEKVWFQKDERSVKAAEVLIRNSQTWENALILNKIPYEKYSPATWRKGFIAKKDRNKPGYVKVAKEMFPKYEHLFDRHDRAEATLIAYRALKHVESGMPLSL